MNQVNVCWSGENTPGWVRNVKPFIRWVLVRLGKSCWEVNILFTDRITMKCYNGRYRGRNYSTDILSFAREQSPPICYPDGGDLLVCTDVVAEHASTFAVDFQEELNRTLIHGLLHLAGWDHDEENPEGPMLDLQEKMLTDAFTQEEHIYVAVA